MSNKQTVTRRHAGFPAGWGATPLACLLMLLIARGAEGQTIVYGESVSLGDGMAQTWIEVDAENKPLRIGMTLTEGALLNLPTNARVMSLDLPEVVEDALFKHVMFDWAPSGHPPSVYRNHRHFDFHFYMLSEADRLKIAEGNDLMPIPAEHMPEDYIPVPGLGTYAFPRMGVHYVDLEAPELNGEPFSKTLIYGFYKGEMIFIEPMITVSYLQTHPDDTLAIKQPAAYQKRGYYPTTYQIKYHADSQAFDVFLTDFVLRESVSTAAEGAPSDRPASFILYPNYPNPFNPSTTIRYDLHRPGRVTLAIYDGLGRRVRTLVKAVQPAGTQHMVWDGRNDAGEVLASGIYMARMQMSDVVQSQMMLLVK